MKKLIIVLILFLATISAFAEDKPWYIKNFSLINHSRADNRGLFEIDIFSKRTPFSIIATVENRNQKWGTWYNLIYGQQEAINSEKKSESLAERYLKRMAERNKRSRKSWGYGGLIGGGICLALGAAALSAAEKTESWWEGFWLALGGASLTISGVVGVGSGILYLAIPSGAEREYGDVLRIQDPVQRERASHEALVSLAQRGRLRRIITGAVFAAIAVYSIASNEEGFSLAAEFGGFAAYNFLRKSRAERTYHNYLKEKQRQKELELRIGIEPYAGARVSLYLSF